MLAVLLNACATDEDLIEEPDASNPGGEIGTFALDQNYLLEAAEGIEVVDDHPVTLRLESGDDGLFLNLNAGCNLMGGAMETIDEVLHVNELSSTLKACSSDLMQQDITFGDFITSRPQMRWDSSVISLSNGSTKLRFVLESATQTDLSLTDTLWTLNSVIEDGVTSSTINASQQSILLESNGEAKINSACNSCFATYEVSGNQTTQHHHRKQFELPP